MLFHRKFPKGKQLGLPFLKIQLFPGTFQWNVRKTCVPSTSQLEFSEFLSKWKAPHVQRKSIPIFAHVQNFDFCLSCREIKRCEESKRTLKNLFASRLAEFDTTLKLLRIAEQLYIVPIKFRFARNLDFLALISLPLAGGPREGKRFNASWWLISPASFHTSSDNRERNTQKWNCNNKDYVRKKKLRHTSETWMWLTDVTE